MWSSWREGVSGDKALRFQKAMSGPVPFSFSLPIDHDVALDYFPSPVSAMLVALPLAMI